MSKKNNSKSPVIALGLICLLCWLCGFLCISYALLCRHRGEIVVPDAVTIVPVILYKEALDFIHLVKFDIIPMLGGFYILTALGLTVFLYHCYRGHGLHSKDNSDT